MEFGDQSFRPTGGGEPAEYGALAIGHSHLTALQNAYKERTTNGDSNSSLQVHFIQLLNEEFQPPVVRVAGDLRLNEQIEVAISKGIYDLPQKKAVILSISGNEYHFFGLFNHSRRYDFFLPERPDLPPLPGAEIIPTALIEAKLRRNIRAATEPVRLIKTLVGSDIPVYALTSPPPIPDNEYVLTTKSVFSVDLQKYGVSPASLRFKLWRLQSRLFKEYMNDAGVMYLRAPADTIDEAGFMLPPGWHPDAVHGSSWFGNSLLKQIEGLFEVPAADGVLS